MEAPDVLEDETSPMPADRAEAALPARSVGRRGVIGWTVLAVVMLGVAGAYRAVQARRYESEVNNYFVSCPFPLSSVPKQFGEWHVVEGSETTLDPLTTRITGSTDHIIRNYVDDNTGVTLTVLILFGPAQPVMPHTPQVCYPATGFQLVDDTIDRPVDIPGHPSNFRSSVYAKPGGRVSQRQVVYHAFRLDGPWLPDLGGSRKFHRKNPGIFKVQINRSFLEGERRGANDPIEQFLQKLIPVMDQMIEMSADETKPTK